MTIKAVIFDWAGTTIDYGSRAPIVAFQKAFANVGIQISEAEIRQDMGLDKYTHIHKIRIYRPFKTTGRHVSKSYRLKTTAIKSLATSRQSCLAP